MHPAAHSRVAHATILALLLASATAHADGPSTAPPPAAMPATAPAPASAYHAPPPAPAPLPNTTWYKDTLGDTLALVGVATVAVGGGFFAGAVSASGSATSGNDASWVSERNTAKVDSILGTVFLSLGVVIFGAGQYRYFTVSNRGYEDREESAARAVPDVGFGIQKDGFSFSYGAKF